MNQMFVIDIYLNKFKNHFCSINPRFFRYFACGLNSKFAEEYDAVA